MTPGTKVHAHVEKNGPLGIRVHRLAFELHARLPDFSLIQYIQKRGGNAKLPPNHQVAVKYRYQMTDLCSEWP
jgi:hypothetical protein